MYVILQITGREIPEVVESCVKFIKKFGEYRKFELRGRLNNAKLSQLQFCRDTRCNTKNCPVQVTLKLTSVATFPLQ